MRNFRRDPRGLYRRKKVGLLKALPVPATAELGLQTVHDKTAAKMNRGHSYAEFLKAYRLLKKNGIRVCVHIINGLPGETDEMMLETAETLGKLRPDGIKLHLLHIIRGTALAEWYQRGEYEPLTMERYVSLVVRQLELLPSETVIERITGDGDRQKLLAPLWSRDKIRVLGTVDLLQKSWTVFREKIRRIKFIRRIFIFSFRNESQRKVSFPANAPEGIARNEMGKENVPSPGSVREPREYAA